MDNRLYATYFEVVAPNPDDWIRRWQWIALPRHPDHSNYWVFSRHQTHVKHASVWKGYRYAGPDDVLTTVDRILSNGDSRILREPIVVQLSIEELTHYVNEAAPHTPWKVIDRAKVVSRKLTPPYVI